MNREESFALQRIVRDLSDSKKRLEKIVKNANRNTDIEEKVIRRLTISINDILEHIEEDI